MNKETLEEAACNDLGYNYQTWIDIHSKDTSTALYAEVINWCKGAKWQSKRMYDYDELRRIAYNAYCLGQLDEPTEGKYNLWIQQFKKK